MPLDRIRRFARKTKDYTRVYEEMMVLSRGGESLYQENALEAATKLIASDMETYNGIKKMLKTYKAHRNILDIDIGIINTL